MNLGLASVEAKNFNPNPFVVPDAPIGPLGLHRSQSGGSHRRYGSRQSSKHRGLQPQKSSLSALIHENLNERNFEWQGDESFHSTEHQFFYEDFEKQNVQAFG